jgi:hypothetical protein
VDALDDLAHVLSRAQFVVGEDTAKNQDAPLSFDFSYYFRNQFSVACVNLARFQRAPEGSGQSAAGRGHDVVECRGAGWEGAG